MRKAQVRRLVRLITGHEDDPSFALLKAALRNSTTAEKAEAYRLAK